MNERYFRFYSHHLGRDIEVLHFGHRGYPLVLFPTTLGRYYEAKDFGLIGAVDWYLREGLVQIYCPDSVNDESWYNRQAHPGQKVWRHIQYDRFLHEEFIPQIRWHTGTGKVAVAGCSFGGYSAANYAFRHPEYVSHLISMSGAFDIKSFLDSHYDDNAYFNNPVDFVPSMDHGELWRMKIILGTSEWDICLDANQRMSGVLAAKNVNHWLDVRGWKEHDWPLWREMFPHYLSLL